MKPFPMPNDQLAGRTVVASVEYRDEPTMIALVLLLEPKPPFFTVALYFQEECPAEYESPKRFEGEIDVLGEHMNIVDAVGDYEDSGGDR